MNISLFDGHVNGRANSGTTGKGPKPASDKTQPNKPSQRKVNANRSGRDLLIDVDQPRRGVRSTQLRNQERSATNATGKRQPPATMPFDDGEEDDAPKESFPNTADEFVGSMYQLDAKHSQRGIFVPEWVLRVTRTGAELLVLSQMVYWFGVAKGGKLRAQDQRNGCYWIYKTHAQLGRECLLTKHQVRGAVRSLHKKGILIVEHDAGPRQRVYYRLNPIKIQFVLEATSKSHTSSEEDDDE